MNRAQRILLALRAEGTEPGMLAWALCRELEQLTELALAARAGQPLVEHFSACASGRAASSSFNRR